MRQRYDAFFSFFNWIRDNITMATKSRADRVDNALNALAQTITRSSNCPDCLIEKLRRHIRPAPANSIEDLHVNAIKLRMRRALLAHSDKDDGPILVGSFDKEMDKLRRREFKLLPAAIALFDPLMFSSGQNSSNSVAERASDLENGRIFGNSHKEPVLAPAHENPHLVQPSQTSSKTPAQTIRHGVVWVDSDTEMKLIKDLLFIFQVL